MAETKITDVIVPEIFTAYTSEQSIYRSRFFQSNVIENSAALSEKLGGGGETFKIPYWKDVTHGESEVPSETVAATINNITADKQIAGRLERVKAWGANDLSGLLAGSDPMQAIADRVVTYWAQDYDKTLISVAKGVIADNIANDSSDLVNVTATIFDDDGVIDTQALLGENGLVGRSDQANGEYVGIAVHDKTYALMRKNDLIDFMPVSGQARPVPFYMGMAVIVDRNMPVDTGVYTTIIFKSGAFAFGQNGNRIEETELDRDPSKGMGINKLYTRRNYVIHPGGFAYTLTPAGVSATNTELATAAAWNRVYEKENIGFVAYKHTIV
jgi:hypothetical protein